MKSLGDLGRLLEGLPRPFVDFLKVQAIIRGAATKLGSSLHDRLRINATYAQKVNIIGLSLLHDDVLTEQSGPYMRSMVPGRSGILCVFSNYLSFATYP